MIKIKFKCVHYLKQLYKLIYVLPAQHGTTQFIIKNIMLDLLELCPVLTEGRVEGERHEGEET